MTALAVIPERITTMILLLLCGCSVVVTTTMAFQPTSMGSVLLSAASLSSPNKHSTQLLDAPVTDPVPVVPAEAVTATVPATTAAPPAAVTTTTTVTQADLGEVTELPNTYVSCGQCGAAYAITAEIMGRPRRMACSVCSHTWFQSADRLGTLGDGFEMIPLPARDVERIATNIKENRHPKHVGDYKMYVGNISFQANEQDLYDLFAEVGPVGDVALVLDQETGRPRGFGFVTMRTKEDGEKCLTELDGVDLKGRNLNVRPPNN